MESMKAQVSTWFTLNKLENATGEEFERFTHFFLFLIHKGYRKTRLKKDDGIDGYITLKNHFLNQQKTTQPIPTQYFSIYGPERKTTWKNNLNKIKKDFEAVLIDSKKNNTLISKWYLVTNFDFIKQHEEDLKKEMHALFETYNIPYESYNKIEFEWYCPTKMITELKSPEQMLQAAAFTNSVEIQYSKLTDYYYPKFTKNALELLVQNETLPTTDQLHLTRTIHKNILFYIPKEEYFNSDTPPEQPYRILRLLKNFTKIHSTEGILVHKYDIKTRQFSTYEYERAKDFDLIKEDAIWYNKNESYILRVEDLSILYKLNQRLCYQLTLTGKYSVKSALRDLYFSQESHKKLLGKLKTKSLGL
ncbi:hypothetical protein bcgnr5378_37570 [Bacillus cereus]|uniref:Uncharacterized protein n=1 Tax=Bacillus cereus TaxID=1396 RepID=A0A164QMN9_BACCE|nr:hypothetical protein [Bacillus cereus]KZD71913.1 hypothetical protein B4088_0374 [Bacillus cereus]